MNRGIVAIPAVFKKISDNNMQIGQPLSLDEMRYYALYWDKVVIPESDLVSINLPQQDSFVLAGALERIKIPHVYEEVTASIFVDSIFHAQSVVAENLIKDETTDWVIQQHGDECILLDEYSEKRNTLRIDLASYLPVPTGNVNIYDILDFKEFRRNEFIALHGYLDEVYEQALLSPDQTLASKRAISQMAESIEDLDKVTRERFKIFKKHNLSTVFNVYGKKIAEGLIMDFVSMAANGPMIPTVTLGNIIYATMKVSSESVPIFKPANKNLKLAYLSRAQKDGLY